MEEKREGDMIICTIYTFFFLCLTGGGSFLFVYMLSDQPQEWHIVAGMTLVGLPWGFWILTCAYTFVKHRFMQPKYMVDLRSSRSSSHPSTKNNSFKAATATEANSNRLSVDSPKMGDRSSTDSNSPEGSSGDRRVRFAGVVVMGDEESQDHGRHKHVDEEAELPIASSV